jgi:senataxin
MWNIFHEGEEPPSNVECSKVSDTFQTHLDYRNTFYPLLISEAWRSFKTAKEENSSRPFPIKVVNRMSIDHFYEVSTTMAIAENRDTNLMEGDIVLLSKAQHPLKDPTAAHCLARIFRITRKKDILEISYRVNGAAANGAGANGTPILPHLAPNTTVQGYKITSMTTIEREYASLNSLQFYDLCEEILEGKPSPLLPYSRQVLEPIQRNYAVNMGQAKAIWSARENDAFTLIQGYVIYVQQTLYCLSLTILM